MNFIINESEQKLRGGYHTPLDLAAYIAPWTLAKKPLHVLAVLPLAVVAYLGIMVLLYARFGLLVDGLYHLAAFIVTW